MFFREIKYLYYYEHREKKCGCGTCKCQIRDGNVILDLYLKRVPLYYPLTAAVRVIFCDTGERMEQELNIEENRADYRICFSRREERMGSGRMYVLFDIRPDQVICDEQTMVEYDSLREAAAPEKEKRLSPGGDTGMSKERKTGKRRQDTGGKRAQSRRWKNREPVREENREKDEATLREVNTQEAVQYRRGDDEADRDQQGKGRTDRRREGENEKDRHRKREDEKGQYRDGESEMPEYPMKEDGAAEYRRRNEARAEHIVASEALSAARRKAAEQNVQRANQTQEADDDLQNRKQQSVIAVPGGSGKQEKYYVVSPKQLGTFGGELAGYEENSFLLHGYYNYRHILVGPIEEEAQVQSMRIGVPGNYYKREEIVADMFGFIEFIPSKGETQTGAFGYYYTRRMPVHHFG